MLDYVEERTAMLLRRGPDRYLLNPDYAPYSRLGFHFDKLMGAYGPLLDDLEAALVSGPAARDLVDEQALADAFAGLGSGTAGLQAHVMREWDVDSLLDLGCGSGSVLIELASANAGFRGWGVDASASMCAVALERVERAGVGEAVRIVHADVRELECSLDESARCQIDALHGRSLLNELFAAGPGEATRLVAMLSRLFPGRLFFVSDYYGKLGLRGDLGGAYGQTLLQDVAQVLSGQGVPPPDLAGWAQVYLDAEVELLHAYEDERDGVAWFIHVLRL